MCHDASYDTIRANEERRIAMACSDPRTRKIHLELAAKHAALSDALLDAPEVQGAVAKRLWTAAVKRGFKPQVVSQQNDPLDDR